jgi:hypothetical protein
MSDLVPSMTAQLCGGARSANYDVTETLSERAGGGGC